MKRAWIVLTAVVLASACARVKVPDTDQPSEAQLALRAMLGHTARPPFVTADAEGARLWKLTRAFYERREHKFAWIDEKHPTGHMDALISALKAADREGLDPEMYSLSALEARRQDAAKGFLRKKGFDPKEAGPLEVFLTYLYMKYASDLADGISDLAHADRTWRIEPERFEPLNHLEKALAENRVAESLADLRPDAPSTPSCVTRWLNTRRRPPKAAGRPSRVTSARSAVRPAIRFVSSRRGSSRRAISAAPFPTPGP